MAIQEPGNRNAVDAFNVEVDVTAFDNFFDANDDTVQKALEKLDEFSGGAVGPHTHLEADVTDLNKYTQQEIDAALLLKSPTTHNHDGDYSAITHEHEELVPSFPRHSTEDALNNDFATIYPMLVDNFNDYFMGATLISVEHNVPPFGWFPTADTTGYADLFSGNPNTSPGVVVKNDPDGAVLVRITFSIANTDAKEGGLLQIIRGENPGETYGNFVLQELEASTTSDFATSTELVTNQIIPAGKDISFFKLSDNAGSRTYYRMWIDLDSMSDQCKLYGIRCFSQKRAINANTTAGLPLTWGKDSVIVDKDLDLEGYLTIAGDFNLSGNIFINGGLDKQIKFGNTTDTASMNWYNTDIYSISFTSGTIPSYGAVTGTAHNFIWRTSNNAGRGWVWHNATEDVSIASLSNKGELTVDKSIEIIDDPLGDGAGDIDNGSLRIWSDSGAITLDTDGWRRIGWNDGNGNFTMSTGLVASGILHPLASSGVNMQLQDSGSWTVRAFTGVGGGAATYGPTFTVDTTSIYWDGVDIAQYGCSAPLSFKNNDALPTYDLGVSIQYGNFTSGTLSYASCLSVIPATTRGFQLAVEDSGNNMWMRNNKSDSTAWEDWAKVLVADVTYGQTTLKGVQPAITFEETDATTSQIYTAGGSLFYKAGNAYMYFYPTSGTNTYMYVKLNDTWRRIVSDHHVDSVTLNNTLSVNGATYHNNHVYISSGYLLSHNSSASYDKLRVWNTSSHTIGMNSSMTFGALANYAMTFTMNNVDTQGWVWRRTEHAKSAGCMSLSTSGDLHVGNDIYVHQYPTHGNAYRVANVDAGNNVRLCSTASNYSYMQAGQSYDTANPRLYLESNRSVSGWKGVYLIQGDISSTFSCSVDNWCANGSTSLRWTRVYAVNGTIGTSDERLKNFFPIGDTSWIFGLEPRAYRWKDGKSGLRMGFSAQKTYEVMPDKELDLVEKPEKEEEYWGMNMVELIAPMLKEMQKMRDEIKSLKEQVHELSMG